MDIFLSLYFVLAGLFAGFMAGLLGVGGGLLMVPVLSWAFLQQGFTPEYNIHIALATSLAVIVPTSLSSLRAHHAHGAVDWTTVRRITPGILLGTVTGGFFAARLPDAGLKIFFTVFLFYAATQMLIGFKPPASRQMPGMAGMSLAGGVIGLKLGWHRRRHADRAIPDLVQHWAAPGYRHFLGDWPADCAGRQSWLHRIGADDCRLPPASIGFVYLPALVAIALGSWLTAPFGARATHRLPVQQVKRIFAGLLYLLAVRMAYGVWAG